MSMGNRESLEALLDESLTTCKRREQNTFDEATFGTSGLVLFGAGGLGRKVLAALRADGIEPLAFADNKLYGSDIDGVKVYTPAEAARLWGKSSAFVVTIWAAWADSMCEQIQSLRTLGCETVVSFIPLLWKYPALLPHVQIDLPSHVLCEKDQIMKAFDLWSDEGSRREFVSQLRWRLLADFAGLHPPVPNQYWQGDIIHLKQDAIFADAGAFDGDTFEQFVSFTNSQFGFAYLFEPDKKNLLSLESRLKKMPDSIRTRIRVFAAAVAEKTDVISFQGGAGVSSAPGAGSEVVHCVSLDETLPEAPDYIKYDIEGFELLGLNGARRIIKEKTPTLAVCAYHIQNHLWQIPLLIQSLNPDYDFYLRPHGQIWETVCYAVPHC